MKRAGYLAALSGARQAAGTPVLRPPRRLFAHEPAFHDELQRLGEPDTPVTPTRPGAPQPPAALPRPALAPNVGQAELEDASARAHHATGTRAEQHPRTRPVQPLIQSSPPAASLSGQTLPARAPTASASNAIASPQRVSEPAEAITDAPTAPTRTATARPPSRPTTRPEHAPAPLDHAEAAPRARQPPDIQRDGGLSPRDPAAAAVTAPTGRPTTMIEHRSQRLARAGLEPFAPARPRQAGTRRAARLHIGKIEVTVTAPAPATAPLAQPQSQPRAHSAQRKSTAAAAGTSGWFGLAQR